MRVADDAVVVHCAADGLKNPPLISVWRPEDITVQPVRAGFPCFSAAVIGYVEATRTTTPRRTACARRRASATRCSSGRT